MGAQARVEDPEAPRGYAMRKRIASPAVNYTGLLPYAACAITKRANQKQRGTTGRAQRKRIALRVRPVGAPLSSVDAIGDPKKSSGQ